LNFINLIEKCTDCRKCEDYCSIFLSSNKYSPYEKLKVAEQILKHPEKPENWETIFYCTKCEACDEICPEEIPVTRIIDEARKVFVKKWGIQFPRQRELIENILKTGNPFGKETPRLEWLDSPIKKESKNLLFLGCMISYLYPEMGKSIISILKKLEIDFTVSSNETCCGYFVYNVGEHEIAQKIVEKNVQLLEKYDTIITACAGCTTFIRQNYGLKNNIHHAIEVINDQLQKKGIKLEIVNEKIAIYHDSCHISKQYNVIEQPRNVLRYLGYSEEKNNLMEFSLSKKKGTCCGADGGMRIVNRDLAIKIGKIRVREASEKADILFTLCPFCINNFRKAAQKSNIDMEIKDIFEELDKIL